MFPMPEGFKYVATKKQQNNQGQKSSPIKQITL